MELHNTLSGKKETFTPIGDEVRLYSCGPTVYDIAHIGNLRTYIFNDLLKRVLLVNGFKIKHVMNVTDVDDKTILRSGGERAAFDALTKKYEDRFFQDLKSLNILPPDVITRATSYIDQMVKFIEDLLNKGYAYKGNDGSVYFSIEKFADYGKLSKLDKEGLKVGARVSQDEYTKDNPADFALWKAWDLADGDVFWETSLGKGRPGWHIECSVMASTELGETIDIHTGAVDLIFPHHENEIAQSEARSGKQFVRFWVHGEHLLVDNQKMSKSAGNFYVLDDIRERGFDSLDFRYLVVGSHYRSKLNFTWEGLESARNSRMRLLRLINELLPLSAVPLGASERSGVIPAPMPESGLTPAGIHPDYYGKFLNVISDDLNTPEGLAVLWQLIRDESVSPEEKYGTIKKMEEVMALGLFAPEKKTESAPDEIRSLAEKRQKARLEKDFVLADELRKKIKAFGWSVADTEEGFELTIDK